MLKDMFTISGRWGRLNRLRYFGYGVLANVVLAILVLAIVFIGIGGALSLDVGALSLDVGALGGILFLILPLYGVLFWVALCLMVKRLHDLNQSGWWVLFLFGFSFVGGFISGISPEMENLALVFNIPVIGFVLWLLFWPGTAGDNQYGPDPLEQ